MRKQNRFRLVLVEWHDAHGGTETWTHLDDLKQDRDPYVVYSAGFLLEEGSDGKPGHVSITQSWSFDDSLDSVLHVPIAMVQRVVYLKGPERDKGKRSDCSPKTRRSKGS